MSVPGPVLGPCESWIDGDDVAACCASEASGSDSALTLEAAAFEASMALYELSGRQFSGLCGPVTVRPCLEPCPNAWPIGAPMGGSWYWTSGGGFPAAGYWGWRNERGYHCGCRPVSKVKLNGYPVREITEVKIDGVVLDELDTNSNPNYELQGWRFLVRMDDPTAPLPHRFWPRCQNLALDDTQPSTFSVSYRYGVDPPELGRRAAAQLACQLLLACASGDGDGECVLPDGVTRVTRQGVTIERELLLGFLDPKKPTGLIAVDLFMASYARVTGSRRPAVWSPDVQGFAQRTT